MKTSKAMLEYITTCSKISLESFQLARLNDRANLRKQMIEILDELIEVDIQARVAEWVLMQRRRQEHERRAQERAELENLRRPLQHAGQPGLPMRQDELACAGRDEDRPLLPPELPPLGHDPVMSVLIESVNAAQREALARSESDADSGGEDELPGACDRGRRSAAVRPKRIA